MVLAQIPKSNYFSSDSETYIVFFPCTFLWRLPHSKPGYKESWFFKISLNMFEDFMRQYVQRIILKFNPKFKGQLKKTLFLVT